MATTINRQQRQATPARWRKAVERALTENVQVRQLAGSGAWIATSGSDSSAAYELEVTGDVAHGCNCLAGLNGDPVCKHRAAFYLAVGLLDPEPEPPVPALTLCGYCGGRGWDLVTGKSGADYRLACAVCDGAGSVTEEEDDEPSARTAGPGPIALTSAVCARCGGSGRLCMTVAGGCGRYLVDIACRACHGADISAPPVAAIAA